MTRPQTNTDRALVLRSHGSDYDDPAWILVPNTEEILTLCKKLTQGLKGLNQSTAGSCVVGLFDPPGIKVFDTFPYPECVDEDVLDDLENYHIDAVAITLPETPQTVVEAPITFDTDSITLHAAGRFRSRAWFYIAFWLRNDDKERTCVGFSYDALKLCQ